jgi:hypothetical protein
MGSLRALTREFKSRTSVPDQFPRIDTKFRPTGPF